MSGFWLFIELVPLVLLCWGAGYNLNQSITVNKKQYKGSYRVGSGIMLAWSIVAACRLVQLYIETHLELIR